MNPASRIQFEKKTVAKMIGLYCRNHHADGLSDCTECTPLLDYALARIDHCRFFPLKPACVSCPVHCFRKDMRERIRQVMRYSGPRMILHHPLLALKYLYIKHTIKG
jgi:hypothetical protein